MFSSHFTSFVCFNLGSCTHMHVQGMFVAEEFGSARAPPSDESRNNSGRKLQ